MKIGRYTYDVRGILKRHGGKVIGGVIVMAALLAFYAGIQAYTAVQMGALDKPVYGCIDAPHANSRAQLVDPAFARLIAGHYIEKPVPGGWHAETAFATVGMKLVFSANERREMLLPALEALPVCD